MGSLPITAFVKPLGTADWLHFLVHPQSIFRVTTPGGLGDPKMGQGILSHSDQQSPYRKPLLTQTKTVNSMLEHRDGKMGRKKGKRHLIETQNYASTSARCSHLHDLIES